MGAIDEVLMANQSYAGGFTLGQLSLPPTRKLAVVACMDARLMVDQILGLKAGEAHVIRNAGALSLTIPCAPWSFPTTSWAPRSS